MSEHSHLPSGPVHVRLLRHAEAPGKQSCPPGATGVATETGQCGDSVDVFIRVENEHIADIGVAPHGCLYTVVCASALGKLAQGLDMDQALALGPEDVEDELGGLPEDHLHCARLVINTLGEAIADHYRRAGTGAHKATAGS
ncbi:MAG: iron-sulfur cluster assembly scaffold protein [Desulfarculaceae bacterium]|nr:iron-sulfur cluster assembly scaffold protein [Desulfarculaceae bacterium]MCF8071478.1 iron-sulfur cluster assembly scaffold protein [Desulfarculaceae bacterium]MCF8103394.1 iron-sulfur cluster assembly scaffold protein [Desulfarculaceae bacterium]MCF8118054.1 iron-sulfur cluster assembly scaffold protein [Desulfarculaceae bacterium]